MKTAFRILIINCLPLICFSQSIRPEVKLLADSIANNRRMDPPFLSHTQNDSLFTELATKATVKELQQLAESSNTNLKCIAFQSLCKKGGADLIDIVKSHLYDTSLVYTKLGCIVDAQMTGDYFLDALYSNLYLLNKDSDYVANNYKRLNELDSLVIYDPKIRLDHKISWINGLNGDTTHYNRVRDIAIYERIPVSVLALAKYKKQQDIPIIKSYFNDDKNLYHAVWAVREFSDTSFYPLLLQVFEAQWKHSHYNYTLWRVLYQALAKYPNEQTLALFDRTTKVRKKFKRETLGRYLSIAITKYPNALYSKYQDKVEIDNLHRQFLDAEAAVEQ